MKKIILGLFTICFISKLNAQCFSDASGKRLEPVIASFANKGDGKYKNEILWLNWGATSPTATMGSSVDLKAGDYSNAEIKINDDKYICIKTVIDEVSNVKSAQIDKAWSIMDETYDHTSGNMFHVLQNKESKVSTIKLSSTAYVLTRNSVANIFDKNPIKIKGVVLADAESAASTEYLSLTGKGTWNVVEFIKLPSTLSANYHILKSINGLESSLTVGYGGDTRMAAINMLKFNDNAYGLSTDNYKVSFSSTFQGGGNTSISIGLITPYADFADAPSKYSSPMHLIESLEVIADNYDTEPFSTVSGKTTYKNIGNSSTFKPGSLSKSNSNFIGSTAPDPDPIPYYSDDAKGDDYTYNQNGDRVTKTTEEDGWPSKYQGFSYKTVNGSQYPVGAVISADIPVVINKKSVLAGWIDFNVNGIFEEKERVYQVIEASQTGNIKLDWKIPVNRKPYSTFVRLRLFDYTSLTEEGVFKPELITATSDVIGGEVEDHEIKIFGQMVSNPMILNSSPTYKN